MGVKPIGFLRHIELDSRAKRPVLIDSFRLHVGPAFGAVRWADNHSLVSRALSRIGRTRRGRVILPVRSGRRGWRIVCR